MERIFEPYQHDCPNCQWLGWGHDGKKLTNMYLCKGTHLLIRYSSAGSDYRSYELGCTKGAIGIGEGIEVEYGDAVKINKGKL